jgi:phosphoribosyl 1,2-cyclic phosphate phosphodiesterase
LFQTKGKNILVDTSPDLRQQLLVADVSDIDAVLFTHTHGDHVHGFNDLGLISRIKKQNIPIYGTEETIRGLETVFAYAFGGEVGHYRPFVTPNVITPGQFEVAGVPIVAFDQDHGLCRTLGFRIGDVAYSTDLIELSEEAFEALKGVQVWVVDCLGREPHLTHSYLEKTLSWIERLKPQRAILTHMGVQMDYETLRRELPKGVEPAYDGMEVEG